MVFEEIKKQIIDKIEKYDNIVIFRHKRPDGDAIGSSLGLREILRTNYPEKQIYSIGDGIPEYLNFVGQEDEVDISNLKNALAIVVDTATLKRAACDNIEKFSEIIKIDHHISVDSYGNLNYVLEDWAACALMIMDLFEQNPKFTITEEAARYLYIGTVTDTGRFKYQGVDGRALELGGKMIEKGFNTADIYANLEASSIEKFNFKGVVIRKTKFTRNKVAYSFISKEDREKYNVSEEDASSMVNVMDGIKGSMVWALFIEQDDQIRVRLRSRFLPIVEVAEMFNGGGHANAAGATVMDKEEMKVLLKEADKRLKKYKEKHPEKF